MEILTVVCILGIVAAALVTPLNSNVYAPRLRTAANVLAADIDYCASECIAQPSNPRVIQFDLSNNKYSMLDFNAGTVLKFPGDGQDFINDFSTGRNAQFSGVTIRSITSGGSAVTSLAFDAYGKPLLTADLIITLGYNNQTLTLTVKYTTGDVTISGG